MNAESATGDGQAPRIRILLADDHAAVRAGLRLMVEQADDIEVVGEAGDGESAVRMTRAARPQVVLMDVRMPGGDGIEATGAIVREGLADVLVLTTFDLDEVVFAALEAGAVGFLLKTVTPDELVAAVRRVAEGEGVVAPEVTRRVLDRFAQGGAGPRTPVDGRVAELTPRERDVLDGLGRGLSNRAIARELVISEATAKTHVSRVLRKLECSSRMQAAVIARDLHR